MRSRELGAAGAAAPVLPCLPRPLAPRPGAFPVRAPGLAAGAGAARPFRSSAKLVATSAPSSSLAESPRVVLLLAAGALARLGGAFSSDATGRPIAASLLARAPSLL